MNRLAFSDSESDDDDDDDDDDLVFANASALGKVRSTLLPNLLPNTEATPVGKVPNPHPPPEAVPTTEAATSAVLDDDDDDYYSSSHQSAARRRHLEEITHKHDRALQLLLWEIGFGYNIYAHQFEATRFVAGLVPTFPVPSGMTKGGSETTNETAVAAAAIMAEQSANGTQFRSRTLERTALEFSWRLNNNSNNNSNKNNNIPAGDDSRFILTLPTKGMLLADEMGLGMYARTHTCIAFVFCSLPRCCVWGARIRFPCASIETHTIRSSLRFTLLTLHNVKQTIQAKRSKPSPGLPCGTPCRAIPMAVATTCPRSSSRPRTGFRTNGTKPSSNRE
jgi:hypothetical protein